MGRPLSAFSESGLGTLSTHRPAVGSLAACARKSRIAGPQQAEELGADGSHLSWGKVAQALKLGSPGAARRAYSALVGPHTGSVLPNRPQGTKGAGVQPVAFTDDTTLDELREAIAGRTVVVQRADHTESIPGRAGDQRQRPAR